MSALQKLIALRVSPRTFRHIALAAVVAMSLIIITGAAVRLTGSGLGCPDWPTCAAGRVVAPLRYHAWVEFGNRLVTAALSVVVALAVLGAWRRSPRRRDLDLLSWGLLGGIVGEIILGGLTVEHKLAPGFVMAHFLFAALFLSDAVILFHRSGLVEVQDPRRPGRALVAGHSVPVVSREVRWLARMLLVSAGVVIALGSVVTSTGPHGGSPEAPRFNFSMHDVAQLHGTSVEVLLAFTVVTLLLAAREHPAGSVMRRGEVLLVCLVVQGAIGYTQYLIGDPALLVFFHVAGSVSVMITVVWFNLSLTVQSVTQPVAALEPATSRSEERAEGEVPWPALHP